MSELNSFGFFPVQNLSFISVTLTPKDDFLSSALSGERSLILQLTFSLFSE